MKVINGERYWVKKDVLTNCKILINMKVINGERYWVKKDVLKEFPISERTFFTRIKGFKSVYPQNLMNNNRRFWVIHESIVKDVFKVEKKPRKTEIGRWKKWMNHIQWDLIGNIRPIETNVNGNVEIMNYLFQIMKDKFKNNRRVEMVYCIENNGQGENQHSHFLVKTNLTKQELKHLKNEIHNSFPNYKLERYNQNLLDSGIKYTSKHMCDDIDRFGYLSNDYNGK
jgi:hypothetical protein